MVNGAKKRIWQQKPGGIIRIIDPSIPNFENHPFFVKKAAEAKAFIERVGIPYELLKKK